MPDLFSPPVIGIDLGASFTKVSYRPGWQNQKRYDQQARLVVVGKTVLIPSLVIFVPGRNVWLCGNEAAAYRPTATDQVFENWKAAIFQQTLNAGVDGALDAAGHFFQWLADTLVAADIPVSDSRVKVCLPAFPNIEGPASILAQRMFRCGWSNVSASKIEEPRANMLGVFSEGNNVLFRREPSAEPNPVFLNMFQGTELIRWLREHAFGRGPQTVTCAVLDIGSFTTDVSVVRVNALQDGDCLDGVNQVSFPLGMIKDYEEPVLSAISGRHKFEPRQLSFHDRENIKRSLEGRRPFSILLPGDRQITLGTPEDLGDADNVARYFANYAIERLESVAGHERVQKVILTGGGIAVGQLKSALLSKLQASGREVIDLPRPDQIGLRENARMAKWNESGSILERTATALGAASVLLDFPAREQAPIYPNKTRAPSPYTTCACRGANKDCMRCGGAGHYRTR